MCHAWQAGEESRLLEALFPLHFSKVWLLTLQDIAPIIGIVVMVIIVVGTVLFIVWWYRFWMKRGLKEYERKHGKIRLKSASSLG